MGDQARAVPVNETEQAGTPVTGDGIGHPVTTARIPM